MSVMQAAQVNEDQQAGFRRWWFKIENNINADLRYARLSNAHFGIYIRMVALANTAQPGRIDGSVADVAFTIRVTEDEMSTALKALKDAGLVVVKSGAIHIVDADLHYAGAGLTYSDSREGMRERQTKSRAKRASEKSLDGHSDMSRARVEQSQTRADVEEDEEGEAEQTEVLAYKREVPIGKLELNDTYAPSDYQDAEPPLHIDADIELL